ncbi:MAG: hypothetical protein JO066_10475 [Verrucomicrobia bacterium]|nr:hypothetical protein [Verrucomicrobiota bacterium]
MQVQQVVHQVFAENEESRCLARLLMKEAARILSPPELRIVTSLQNIIAFTIKIAKSAWY